MVTTQMAPNQVSHHIPGKREEKREEATPADVCLYFFDENSTAKQSLSTVTSRSDGMLLGIRMSVTVEYQDCKCLTWWWIYTFGGYLRC